MANEMKCLKCYVQMHTSHVSPAKSPVVASPHSTRKNVRNPVCSNDDIGHGHDTRDYGTVWARYGHGMGKVWEVMGILIHDDRRVRSMVTGTHYGSKTRALIDRSTGSTCPWITGFPDSRSRSRSRSHSNIIILKTFIPLCLSAHLARPLATSPPASRPRILAMARLVQLAIALGSAVAFLLIRLFWRRRSLL